MRAPAYSEDPNEIFAADTIEDPQPFYARLRKAMPVARVGDTGVHIVTSWALVEEALGREEDFSANLTGVLMRGADGDPAIFSLEGTGATQVISNADEPDHSVHRGLLRARLIPARVAHMEASVRGWADGAIAPHVARSGGDFVSVAERVPALTLANLLGLPESDVEHFRIWAMMGGDILAGAIGGERMRFLFEENRRMHAYLSDHLGRADAATADRSDATVMAVLARGVADGVIDRRTAVGISIVLFGAAGESTAALIGSCLLRLARNPALADELRSERSLVPRFVEEVVRLDPPFNFHYRAVRRDCQLGGCDLAPGDRLLLAWAAVNRDESVIEDPDTLRLDRRHPKHHMGFGRGMHFCLGSHLARLEARCVVEGVLQRTKHIRTDDSKPIVWARSIFIRRLERLPLAVVA
jgi:cytochrome P450 family 144